MACRLVAHKQPLDPPFSGCSVPHDEEILGYLQGSHSDYREAELGQVILVRPEGMARHLDGLNDFKKYWAT